MGKLSIEELEREVNALRYELEQERRIREIARKKADADLLVAIIQSNAYSDEILRIHRVERGSQRGNEVLNTIVTEYKTRKGLK